MEKNFSKYLFVMLIVILCISVSGTFIGQTVYAQKKIELNNKTYIAKDKKWYLTERGKEYEVHPSVITIKFKAEITTTDKTAFFTKNKLTAVRTNKLGFVDVEIEKGKNSLDVIKTLQKEGAIEVAEVNTIGRYVTATPNDAHYPKQYHLRSIQAGSDTSACAWNCTTGDTTIIIGVLDSGTDIGHEDLIGNIWINPGEDINNNRLIDPAQADHLDAADKNGVDNDGNGYTDDLCGWDFDNSNNNVRGPYYHGTHVAGIVAAMTNDTIGVAGVAGGWGPLRHGCKVMIVGVGDNSPNGSVLDDAIIYAADNGAQIITMSLSVGQTAAIDAALTYAYSTRGVFIDCAAGNDYGGSVDYPANNTNVVAVSSIDSSDVIAAHSNIGPEIELCAPGIEIWSTQLNNTYGKGNGTSFAAPQVAGVAALLLSARDTLTNVQVRTTLENTAVDLGAAGRDNSYGFGKVNARAAVEAVGCATTCTCSCSASARDTKNSIAWVMVIPALFVVGWRWRVRNKR